MYAPAGRREEGDVERMDILVDFIWHGIWGREKKGEVRVIFSWGEGFSEGGSLCSEYLALRTL